MDSLDHYVAQKSHPSEFLEAPIRVPLMTTYNTISFLTVENEDFKIQVDLAIGVYNGHLNL